MLQHKNSILKFLVFAVLALPLFGKQVQADALHLQGSDAPVQKGTDAPGVILPTRPGTVLEAPVVVETPVVTDTPVVTEPPATGTIEKPALLEKEPVVVETPAVVETPVATPAVEQPVIQETRPDPNLPLKEKPVIVETPVIPEKPIVQEQPVIVQTPAVQETPAPAVPQRDNRSLADIIADMKKKPAKNDKEPDSKDNKKPVQNDVLVIPQDTDKLNFLEGKWRSEKPSRVYDDVTDEHIDNGMYEFSFGKNGSGSMRVRFQKRKITFGGPASARLKDGKLDISHPMLPLTSGLSLKYRRFRGGTIRCRQKDDYALCNLDGVVMTKLLRVK